MNYDYRKHQNGVLSLGPAVITFIYVLAGIIWIQYSDQWVLTVFDDPVTITSIQTYKGWLFVALSGLLIFLLIHTSNRIVAKTAEALFKSQHQFDTTFEEVGVGIAHHSLDEKQLRVNSTLCRMLGYSRKEFLQLDFNDFIHPEDLESGRKLDRELIEGKRQRVQVEKKYRRKDGSYMTGMLTKTVAHRDNESESYLIAVIEDITQRKLTEDALKASLREKEVLLSELHHRVKNNLALISALFELQSDYSENDKIRKILRNSQMRVKSLSMIYETFSGTSRQARMNFGDYLNQLVDYIKRTFGTRMSEVEIDKEISDLQLNINQAVPLGLICNELLMNAYMYAFDGISDPEIKVSLREKDENVWLRIADNGIGLPERIDHRNPETLGFTIIKTLSKQINTDFDVGTSGTGTMFTLEFEKKSMKGPGSSLQDTTT